MELVVLKFPPDAQLTDDELFAFCMANKELRIERDKKGQIIIMPPTGTTSGKHNFKVNAIFGQWALAHENLGFGFDSSTGFQLPNGAMRSPDSAWIRKERWEKLSKEDQEKFAPLTPDFVIEVRSKSDSLKELRDKMHEWIDNGCRLAWLIDPVEQEAYVYTADGSVKAVNSFDEKLEGSDILPGFSLDLAVLK